MDEHHARPVSIEGVLEEMAISVGRKKIDCNHFPEQREISVAVPPPERRNMAVSDECVPGHCPVDFTVKTRLSGLFPQSFEASNHVRGVDVDKIDEVVR